MSDFVFNQALGAGRYYSDLVVAGTGTLRVVLLKTRTENDTATRARATLAALLAASGTTEANWTTGTAYARKTLTNAAGDGLKVTVGTSQVDVDAADLTWLNAGSTGTPQSLTDLIFCYAPAGSPADSAIVPLSNHSYPEIANGADITATLAASGFYRAAG